MCVWLTAANAERDTLDELQNLHLIVEFFSFHNTLFVYTHVIGSEVDQYKFFVFPFVFVILLTFSIEYMFFFSAAYICGHL